MAVPPGRVIRTGYVRVEDVKLACRERMAVGDVDRAYQRRLQLGDHQPWPCPRGHWEGSRFVIIDGRHEFVAALMLGVEQILVAWADGDGPEAPGDTVLDYAGPGAEVTRKARAAALERALVGSLRENERRRATAAGPVGT